MMPELEKNQKGACHPDWNEDVGKGREDCKDIHAAIMRTY